MLKRSFFSDLYKYSSLPTFKITFFLILGVSIFFSIQNIQVINALVEGNGQAVNLDPSMLSSNPVYTVRDALLSSLTKDCKKLRTQRIPSGSSPLIGSSKIKMSGFANKAVAKPRRCFIPNE